MDDMHFWSMRGQLTSLHLILMQALTNYHTFSQSENDKVEKDEADKKEKSYFKYLKMCFFLSEWINEFRIVLKLQIKTNRWIYVWNRI